MSGRSSRDGADQSSSRVAEGARSDQSLHAAGSKVSLTPSESHIEQSAADEEEEFQLASDRIGQVIALCSNQKWKERKKDVPDPTVIDFWNQIDEIASEARRSLHHLSRYERVQLGDRYRQQYLDLKENAS